VSLSVAVHRGIALIAASLIVLNQFRYLTSAGWGFGPEGVLVIHQAEYLGERVDPFRERICMLDGVFGFSHCRERSLRMQCGSGRCQMQKAIILITRLGVTNTF